MKREKFKHILLTMILGLVWSCKPITKEDSDNDGNTVNTPSSVTMITSATNIAQPVVRVGGNFLIGQTIVLYQDSACSLKVGQATVNNTVYVDIQTNTLTIDKTYTFFAKNFGRSGGSSSCSIDFAEYDFDTGQPDMVVRLVEPFNPGINIQPLISVQSVRLGYTARLYSDSSCTTLVGEVFNVITGSHTFNALPVLAADGDYLYWGTQTDPTGAFTSECTVMTDSNNDPLTYTLDTKPKNFSTLDTNPGNNPTPTIVVVGVGLGATVDLHEYSGDPLNPCGTLVASTTASPTASFAIPGGTFTADGPITFYAKQTLASTSYVSPCSSETLTYTLDTSPPTISMVTATPNNILTPQVFVDGLSASATTIQLFTDSTCTTAISAAVAGGAGNVTITTNQLPADGTIQFYAQQVIPGITPSCSSVYAEYVLDTKPASLSVVGLNPDNDLTPTIRMTNIVVGSQIDIYSDSTCTTLLETFTPSLTTTQDVTLGAGDLTADGIHTFYATQTFSGHTSPCSSSFASYTLNTKPSALTMITSNPGNDLTPDVQMSNILIGSTVTIYTDPACTALVGTLPAVGTTTPTINVSTQLPNDGTHTFYAMSDNAGNHNSPCSTASVTYTLDTRPSALTLASPNPGDDRDPIIQASNLVIGADLKLFRDNSCTQLVGNNAAVAAATDTVQVNGANILTVDGSFTYYATQTFSGHTSPCSGASDAYVLNTRATSLTLQTPSPNLNLTPVVRVNGVKNLSTVKLFTNPTCTALVGSAVAAGVFVDITVSNLSADGIYTFYATQTDGTYGLTGPCSTASVSYTLDTKPASLTIVGANPGLDLTPQIQVTGLAGAGNINIYSDATCTTLVEGPVVITGGGSQIVTLTSEIVGGDQTVTYYAEQVIGGGSYTSPCSTASASYVLDSRPTTLTIITANPGNDLTPDLTVGGLTTTGPFGNLSIYSDSTCTTLVHQEVLGGTVSQTVTLANQLANTEFSGDGARTLYATQAYGAGAHVSNCSAATVTYTLDSRPTSITINDTATQVNTGLEPNPDITVGGLEGTGTVNIFSASDCNLGSQIGTAAVGGATQVVNLTAPLTTDTVLTIYANQAYGAGAHVSNCSIATATYTLDTKVDTLTITDANPDISLTPTFQATGTAVAGTLRIYNDACTTEVVNIALGGTGTDSVTLGAPLGADGSTTYYARQDYGGLTTTCSAVTVVHTLETPPESITLVGGTTGTSTTPSVQITGLNDIGAQLPGTVEVFATNDCTGGAIETVALAGTDSQTVALTTTPIAAEGTVIYSARQTFGGGYISPCSGPTTTASYTLDRTPNTLSIVGANPGSTLPTVRVNNTFVGSTINIYTDSGCATPAVGSMAAAAGTTDVTLTTELSKTIQNYTLYAGITGATTPDNCSTDNVSYIVDISPTNLEMLTISPADNLNPKVRVEGVLFGSLVNVYTDSGCTNLAASEIATSSTVDMIIAPGLSGGDGPYGFFAKQIRDGGTGTASGCSTATANYTLDTGVNSNSWTVDLKFQDATTAANELGGSAVAIDSNYAFVGIPGNNADTGSVHIFAFNGAVWTETQVLNGAAPGDEFGYSVDIKGTRAIVGAPGDAGTGDAFVYELVAGTWVQIGADLNTIATPGATDRFGGSVAVNGNTVAVGSPGFNTNEGRVHVITGATYNTLDGTLNPGAMVANDQYGIDVDIEGNVMVVGAPGVAGTPGEAYRYDLSLASPYGETSMVAPASVNDDSYGMSVDLDSSQLIVGAAGNGVVVGAAYVYETTGFTLQATLNGTGVVAGDLFGQSVAIYGSNAYVGAPGTNANEGAIYIFYGATFSLDKQVLAFDNAAGDLFGQALDLSSTHAIVGAPGDQDSVPNANVGSSYIYEED